MMPLPPESDFATFYQMARLIGAGQWEPSSYGWTYQGPGYPLLLAPLAWLPGDGLLAIRLTNAALQVATVMLVWLLARRLFGPTASWLGATLTALLPGLWLFAPLVAGENLAMLLLTTIALLLSRPKPGLTLTLAGGVAVALAYTRPAYLAFPLAIAAALAWPPSLRSLRRLSWYAAGCLLCFAPIAVANQAGGGPLLPLANAGFQQWLVHNERATGAWFPAAAADDYPFAGLDQGGSQAGVIQGAQRKLTVQFLLANPEYPLPGLVHRHRLDWASDRSGLAWTVERAPLHWLRHIPFHDQLGELAHRYYVGLLALAAAAALRFGHLPGVLRAVVLPLIYGLLVYSTAVGDSRFHVPALPLLCAMAGAVLVPPHSRKLLYLWFGVLAALVLWSQAEQDAAMWLILLVVLAPSGRFAAPWIVASNSRLLANRAHRRLVMLATALLFTMLAIMFLGLRSQVDRSMGELAAVDPSGWRSYRSRPGGAEEPGTPAIVDLGVPTGYRKVSYPDAALLRFDWEPSPGEAVGLVRTFPITAGETYFLYLQLFDPGGLGDPSESLSVSANDAVIWEHGPTQAKVAGWQYISRPWVADASAAKIRVERRAGVDGGMGRAAVAAVRSIHLYPKY
jgi:hypothetical protein